MAKMSEDRERGKKGEIYLAQFRSAFFMLISFSFMYKNFFLDFMLPLAVILPTEFPH